ncbi:unnamed protein product [Trifolium pratense]|uniref:Uncharacterized protein n=1 Tax=Trifolium pratense TaxID=57577 RepID=A0ACB0LS47_TRIPR|nr:unnamed protein product [Trifolium pratense]
MGISVKWASVIVGKHLVISTPIMKEFMFLSVTNVMWDKTGHFYVNIGRAIKFKHKINAMYAKTNGISTSYV